MLKPNFDEYSLALIKENEVVFSSQKSGLGPLVECISTFQDALREATLHDKVIGLAAARIIVFSEMINQVKTQLCSMRAKELLEKNDINLKSDKIVKNILTKDKDDICPMEKKAIEIDDNQMFYLEMAKRFL